MQRRITVVKPIILVAIIMGLLLKVTTDAVPATAQDQGTKVIVKVDGLSCPFCAFGLEKKLKKLEGVKAVHLKIDAGVAELIFVPRAVIDESKIRKAVEEGGFTPRTIQVVKVE